MAPTGAANKTCAELIGQSQAKFGTTGLRGLVESLDDATCIAYVTAFLDHLQNHHRLSRGTDIWVGMDLRPSSPAIAQACLAAIRHGGFEPRYCGVIPTPALAFSALRNSAPAVMITGSHIPFERNGIKFFRADGEMLKQDETPVVASTAPFPVELLRDPAVQARRATSLPSLPTAGADAETNWMNRYLPAFDGLLTGLRIGHYQHSAAGRDLLSTLLQRLGADVIALGRSDLFIPIDTEAVTAADTAQAKDWAKAFSFDAIISTDGDGDRPLLGDENGHYIRGDALGILAAYCLKATTVVTPVSSTSAVDQSQWFDTVVRTKIGSPQVIAAMQQAAATADAANEGARIVGFEPNGGFLTSSWLSSPWNETALAPLPTRDSVLPILAVLALSRQRAVPLSQITALLPKRVTASDRVEHTPDDISRALVERLRTEPEFARGLAPGEPAIHAVDETDGLRFTFSNGDIVHVRPSGNAPELRIYVESDSTDAAHHLQAHARQVVKRLIGAV